MPQSTQWPQECKLNFFFACLPGCHRYEFFWEVERLFLFLIELKDTVTRTQLKVNETDVRDVLPGAGSWRAGLLFPHLVCLIHSAHLCCFLSVPKGFFFFFFSNSELRILILHQETGRRKKKPKTQPHKCYLFIPRHRFHDLWNASSDFRQRRKKSGITRRKEGNCSSEMITSV